MKLLKVVVKTKEDENCEQINTFNLNEGEVSLLLRYSREEDKPFCSSDTKEHMDYLSDKVFFNTDNKEARESLIEKNIIGTYANWSEETHPRMRYSVTVLGGLVIREMINKKKILKQ